jgi:hypothetical protein
MKHNPSQFELRNNAIKDAREVLKETEDYQTTVNHILHHHEDCLLYYPEKDREDRARGIVNFAEYQLGILR